MMNNDEALSRILKDTLDHLASEDTKIDRVMGLLFLVEEYLKDEEPNEEVMFRLVELSRAYHQAWSNRDVDHYDAEFLEMIQEIRDAE